MKIRTCDRCKAPTGNVNYKVCRAETKDKRYLLNHVGDLCEKCWMEVMK